MEQVVGAKEEKGVVVVMVLVVFRRCCVDTRTGGGSKCERTLSQSTKKSQKERERGGDREHVDNMLSVNLPGRTAKQRWICADCKMKIASEHIAPQIFSVQI